VLCATISPQSYTASAPLIAATMVLQDTELMSYRTVVSLHTNRLLGSGEEKSGIKQPSSLNPLDLLLFPSEGIRS
jgi:hypothetical protein